jgi:alcohol dehydrogenase
MAIFLPYVMRAYGDAACKKLAELSDVCRLTTPQESDSVKADAFIGWIEELKVKMQIPQYPEMIRKADVKQIAKWAEKEANPLYPTPEVWNRREFERFLLNVCVQGSSEKDRQCCQDK